ncbi:MAG: thiolase family protein [Thermodesulfobacteriota bacterium]|nr:thiolase family protein [Thermodesulfobacteriota bacterium]
MDSDVFVVSAARTPVGKRNGYLREWIAPELLGHVLDAAINRIDLDPALVEDVIAGCVYQVGEQGFTLARMGVFASRKLSFRVPGIAVNRQCGSSLSAVTLGYALIRSGVHDVVIAAGCETMTKYGIASDTGGTLMNGQPMGSPYHAFYLKAVNNEIRDQMQCAQQIAKEFDITQEECLAFAESSHKKAHHATENGYFASEIVPTPGKDRDGNEIVATRDETIRPQTTVETIRALPPVSGTEWISAGLSSPVTDGASAVILMSEQMVKKLNLFPLARIAFNAVVGSEPRLMLTGPVDVWPKMKAASGLDQDDIGLFEVNEAFAPIPLAFTKTYGIPLEKLNVNGGALALGHPVGNSGTRIVCTLVNEMQRRKERYGYVTLCTGGGMAPAVIFERT